MGYVKCFGDDYQCDQWFEIDEKLPVIHELNQFCYFHGGKNTSMNPQLKVPYRRCVHLNERGTQCDVYFPAETDDKLCEEHRVLASPGSRNGISEENKVKYIDLVNDQREYCYHFFDGKVEHQNQELIFQFKDDVDGSAFDKLERHIAFLERVLEDVKARLHTSRAVRGEKLDDLSEDERKELRKIKVERAVRGETERKPRVTKEEKVKDEWKEKLAAIGGSLSMSPDEMIAKFKAMKEKQGQ